MKLNRLIVSASLAKIVLLFGIGLCFRQMDTERLEQIRARAIITQSDNISKLFYDAGVAMGGYSITKSQLFSDRYKKISEQIPPGLQELKSLIGKNPSQQALSSRVETTIQDGMKTLSEAKAAIDENRVDVAQFRSRHMYKGLRQSTDQLQTELKSLTAAEDDKVERAKISSSATIWFYSLLVLSLILDFVVLSLALLSSKRQKKFA